jgi:hypothetical protein
MFKGVTATQVLLLAALGTLATSAYGQGVDFNGNWTPLYHEDATDRTNGPDLGDYMGVPINDGARLWADSFDADRISVETEYQCRPHGADYGLRGLAPMRISTEIDPGNQRQTAIHVRMGAYNRERTIWLDNHPRPSELAPYSWVGFSSGVWEGNMLTVTTDHLKANYIRRHFLPRSDLATVTEHWTRHGNFLTVTTVVRDPVYLTEPLVRSQNWAFDPGQQMGLDPCEYAAEVPKPQGTVPHFLPGTNPFLKEVPEWYGLPYEAARGGAETMYPEYRLKMEKMETPKVPAHCERDCVCYDFTTCVFMPARAAGRK